MVNRVIRVWRVGAGGKWRGIQLKMLRFSNIFSPDQLPTIYCHHLLPNCSKCFRFEGPSPDGSFQLFVQNEIWAYRRSHQKSFGLSFHLIFFAAGFGLLFFLSQLFGMNTHNVQQDATFLLVLFTKFPWKSWVSIVQLLHTFSSAHQDCKRCKDGRLSHTAGSLLSVGDTLSFQVTKL